LAFSHSADPAYADLGWYIDDVQVIKKVPTFTVDFGYGWSDWYADNGVWEVGSPNSAPAECLSNYRMAGTLLNKNYPDYTDSRLISPTFRLPPADSGDSFYLKFNHWWSHASGDYGQVEVSSQDDITGEWSEWKQPSIVIPTKVEGVSGTCQDGYAYLTEYAGKNVRIVFHHITDTSYGSFGWYINGLNFPGLNPVLELNYYTRYIPTCNSTILISANEPRGYDLTCNWDAPDGGEVTGDCSEAEFVATVTQIDPYHVTVSAVSDSTHISSPVRVMRIFTEVLYDSEPDGDIDGADVADAAASFNGTDTSRLAEEFGMVACQ
jgi:hypothetical protein